MHALQPGILVPVTALAALVEQPGEVYDRYVRGVRALPTPSMITGELEHLARKLALEMTRPVYLQALSADDFRTVYPLLETAVEQAELRCDQKYSCLGVNLSPYSNDLTNRLRIEEDRRVAAAASLLEDGRSGFEIATTLLPIQGEVHLRSERLGIEGRLDAIAVRAGKQIPIEYKTGRNPGLSVRPSHRVQLAAYGMLLEESTGRRCSYGEIQYTRYLSSLPVSLTRSARETVLRLRERFLSVCQGIPLDEEKTKEEPTCL